MPYNIVIGRNEEDVKRFGDRGTINLGRLFVKMGQTTSMSNNILMDVIRPHVMTICGKRGSGKCVVEGTLIPLEDGSVVPIEELKDNTKATLSLNEKLRLQKTNNDEFFEREVKKVLHLKLRSGREITLTPEHPLLTIKGWKPAEELHIGSRLAAPRRLPMLGKEVMDECKINLLAYLIGEGYFKKAVLFSNAEEVIVEDFKKNLTEFDQKLILVKDKEYHYRIVEPNFSGHRKRSIRLLLEKMGIWGLGSTERFIPEQILKLNKKCLSLFLRKLFSCDGSIYKTKKGVRKQWEISYCSSSKRMINQIQHLLLRFGILSKIRKKNIKNDGKWFVSYELIISWAQRLLFINEIGFFGKKAEKEKLCLRDLAEDDVANNPNVDTIPKELWDVYRPSVSWAKIGRDVGYAHPKAMRERLRYAPSRQTLLQVARSDTNSAIMLLATSDIFWDEIISMELQEGKFKVYDLSIPNEHNFIANDIIVHNSYSASVIAEEMSRLPIEIKSNLTVLFFDTLGVFWTMKYPNTRQEDLLHDMGLQPEGMNIKIFTPMGFFDKYAEAGIPADVPFAIRTSELSAGDWLNVFDVSITSPLGVLIERVIGNLQEQGNEYSMKDIIFTIESDEKAPKDVKDAAESRFAAADKWGLFYEQGTKIEDLLQPGSVNVLDISAYTNVSGSWSIKGLVIGLISRRLLVERIVARKKEEVDNIKREKSYFFEAKQQEKPLVWIMLDEAHEFLPKQGKTPATDALVQLLREGRQPGISLCLVTQQPGEIHKDVLTQTDIVLSHRLTSTVDVTALNSMMQSYLITDLQGYLNALPRVKGAAILLDDNSERIYPLRIHPKRSWHGGEAPVALKIKKKIEFGL